MIPDILTFGYYVIDKSHIEPKLDEVSHVGDQLLKRTHHYSLLLLVAVVERYLLAINQVQL